LESNLGKDFTVKEIFSALNEEFLMDSIRTEIEVLRRIGEVGGRYKQVKLEDGTRFGYWKYYAVDKPVKAEEVSEDEIEEEF
jgi:hypothetical protein